MNKKPILIVAGEPYSIFSEIFFKSLNYINLKRPIVLIASKKLFINQMKKLGYKFNFTEILICRLQICQQVQAFDALCFGIY